MNFGIKTHGKHSVIKINCKISYESAEEIYNSFEDLVVYKIHKGLTRIEGCIKWESTEHFMKVLKASILKYKIQTMESELNAVLNPHEEDDLPF
jgi:hypothetical protein